MNGNITKIACAILLSLMIGVWGYAFNIDMRKVDKREMDQICDRLKEVKNSVDRLIDMQIERARK